MTSRRPFVLIFAISLAVMLASSAGAATKTATKSKRGRHIAPAASAASSCRGGNLFPCGAVYNGADYLGNDPDPFIRLMIQRDLGVKYGGES